ncbi:hypothetical protein B0H67DRAFT_587276 [Lasiosphaeris hirsuta]|uniref:Uncharacterized protein n=1 Tax=Lasiosphaeris hirsuta TaxID=260670 RepID=A0AA40A102_9PEZI|nr:hypothetical protein B0H67DRAFT_587276 [Lasiosphaeris hirsuta]
MKLMTLSFSLLGATGLRSRSQLASLETRSSRKTRSTPSTSNTPKNIPWDLPPDPSRGLRTMGEHLRMNGKRRSQRNRSRPVFSASPLGPDGDL